MIKVFKINDMTKKEIVSNDISESCWIHLTNPSEEEILKVIKSTNLSEVLLRDTVDKSETAHIDFDKDTKMIVFDTPVINEVNGRRMYKTTPFGIIFNNLYFVTSCLVENTIDITSKATKKFDMEEHNLLMVKLLYRNSVNFIINLRNLDDIKEETETRLQKSFRNKDLYILMDLRKAFVYLSTAIAANFLVLSKLKSAEKFNLEKQSIEVLEDAIIENRQAFEMCNIYRETLNGTLDIFSSIISNNLNSVMKTLTIVTIVLAIPTIVYSFFGMNVPLPFNEDGVGFIIITIVSIVLAFIFSYVLMTIINKKSKGDR